VVDTNHSPDGIAYVIPGTVDSSRAIRLPARSLTRSPKRTQPSRRSRPRNSSRCPPTRRRPHDCPKGLRPLGPWCRERLAHANSNESEYRHG
jgi:hypothetical protein